MRSMWISAASARTLRSPGSEVRISSPSAARHATVASIASRWPLRASSSPARRPSGSSIAATSVPASSRRLAPGGHGHHARPARPLPRWSPAPGPPAAPASTSATTPRSPRSTATNAPASRTSIRPHPGHGPPCPGAGTRARRAPRPPGCVHCGRLPPLLLGDLAMLGLVPRQELISCPQPPVMVSLQPQRVVDPGAHALRLPGGHRLLSHRYQLRVHRRRHPLLRTHTNMLRFCHVCRNPMPIRSLRRSRFDGTGSLPGTEPGRRLWANCG